MNHPVLGPIAYDREARGWVGSLALPTLAPYGGPVAAEFRGEEGYESFWPEVALHDAGRVRLVVRGGKAAGPAAEQVEAVRRLLADEHAVGRRVLDQLFDAFPGTDDAGLRERAWCRVVEVASRRMSGGYPGGVAFVGFLVSGGMYEECPVCVVHHPDREPWWVEAPLDEALGVEE